MLALLLETALRSFVLGGTVWLSLKLLRVRNPQARMTAWTVVLMASLSMPLMMHWVTVTIPAQSLQSSRAVVAHASPATPAKSPPAGLTEHSPATFPPVQPETDAAGRSPGSLVDSAIAAIDWRALAAGFYLAIGGCLLLRILAGLTLTWRLLRKARPITEEWTAGSDVRLSAAVGAPVTFGTTILLPAACLDWSLAKRQAVLSHERSHVARRDFHVLLLATLHRAVFWFSPFSWWLLNELAETAELVSDDAAVETVGDRPYYAEVLLDVARSPRHAPAGIAMARTRTAFQRVERIVKMTALPAKLSRRARALTAASLVPLAAICAVSIVEESKTASAAFQPEDQHHEKFIAAATDLWIGGAMHIKADWPGLVDANDMFSADADWKTVADRTRVVQLPPGNILNGKDGDLERAFQNLARRHIALAIEVRMLVRTGQCQQKTKAYSEPGDLEKMLERIKRLGGDLKYITMVEPFYFGHRFSGPGACHGSAEELARQIAGDIALVRKYYPEAKIGASEVADESKPWVDELANWADVYRQVTGEPLAFLHADVAWSHPAIRNLVPLASAMKARQIPFGIIYNGGDDARSDEVWMDNTRQHIAEIESVLGIRPDTAIFQSWFHHPSHMLPETQPGTLSNLAFQYLQAAPSVTVIGEANILSGQVADEQGHPVTSAGVSVEALDVTGRMELVVRHLAGKVPPEAATAVVGLRVNTEDSCICAGGAIASAGVIRYQEEGTGRQEEIPPFVAAAGNAGPPVRVMQIVPGETVAPNLKRFPVTPGASFNLDVPLSVSANGERAGYVAIMFMDGSGKEVRRERVWFRPSVRSLGNLVTNADGRFQMQIPPRVAEAGAEIRAYFPGSASLRSQTASISQ